MDPLFSESFSHATPQLTTAVDYIYVVSQLLPAVLACTASGSNTGKKKRRKKKQNAKLLLL